MEKNMKNLLTFILLLTSTQLLAQSIPKKKIRKLVVFKLMLHKNKPAKSFMEKYHKTVLWHQKAKNMENSSKKKGR